MEGFDIGNPANQLCRHCDKVLPRRTVYRHMKGVSQPEKRKREHEITDDHRRSVRCKDSSDEEDAECPSYAGIYSPGLEQESEEEVTQHTLNDSEVLADEETLGVEIEDEQIWDGETEDEIRRDIEEYEPPKATQSLTDKAKGIIQWIACSCFYLQTAYKLSNNCMENILLLLHQIFSVVGKFNILCEVIAKCFPKSLYMLRKIVAFERDDFKKFLVCPNCMTLYDYGDIVIHNGERVVIKKCSNKVFGCKVDHSSENRGKRGKFKCGSNLVKEVSLPSGKKFYPLKVFCYKHIMNSLEKLLARKDFNENCNIWRNREQSDDIFYDIYDGAVWSEFQTYKGEPYLSVPNNFAGMINVDWFQPFKRRKDLSVGVIYLVFLNLPRRLRFKPENIILLGIIPALSKEPASLNSFLKPLVEELKIMEKGIELYPFGHQLPVKCKLLLLCAASDIPAARKLCGFMGHSATHGCSFCKIKFVDGNNQRYCGGFSSELWGNRSREEHLRFARQAENAIHLTKMKEIHRTHGYKFTQLLELEYFQPSVFCVVEPMHNLFLGTAKRVFNYWIENDVISNSNLQKLAVNISNVNVSSDIGRLPSNIITNFGQFTADEWKNWVLVYSLMVLHDVLPLRHLKIWQTFVLACSHICRPMTSKTNIHIAHGLFMKFCREVEEIYGPAFITPNMHLHGHLKQCIANYGPIYGFWAFSFERYNGMLADFPTNKRSVEIQIMRKFQEVGFAAGMVPSSDEFQELYTKLCGETDLPPLPSKSVQLASETRISNIDKSLWTDLSSVHVKHEGFSLINLNNLHKQQLAQMYQVLYGNIISADDLASIAKKFSSLFFNDRYIASRCSSRASNCSIVLASWSSDTSNIDQTGELRPGVIQYFIRHCVEIDGEMREHVLAVVEWYKKVDEDPHLNILKPACVWNMRFQNAGSATFIPIQRIISKCAWTILKKNSKKYLVVCPLPHSIYC